MNEQTICDHLWVSNSGQGGEPVFKMNRQMSTFPVMHVKCKECGSRTWVNNSQWILMEINFK